MTDLIATLGSLVAALGNVRSAAAVKEHLALIQEKLRLAQEKAVQLTEENKRLARELDEAKRELAARAAFQQYTQHAGALFRRDVAGRYERVVYCPKCQQSTSSWPAGEAFCCSACRWFSPFTEKDLAKIMEGLPRQ